MVSSSDVRTPLDDGTSEPYFPDSLLVDAVRMDSIDRVQRALDEGAEPNLRIEEYARGRFRFKNASPLLVASFMGEPDIARILLNAGAETEHRASMLLRDHLGNITALHAAILTNQPETVEVLLDAGADANARVQSDGGFMFGNEPTPLIQAVEYPRILQSLLNAGAQPQAVDNIGRDALDHAIDRGAANEIVEAFLDRDLEFGDRLNPALLSVSRSGADTLARRLIKRGADPNYRSPNGETPFSAALESGNALMIQMMTRRLNPSPEELNKALEENVRWQNEKTIRLLVDLGVDPDLPNDAGETLLMWASWSGRESSVRALLQAGADLYAEDEDGTTALEYAVQNENLDIGLAILQSDAFDAKRSDLNEIAWYAAESAHQELAAEAIELGVDTQGAEGRNLLSGAITGDSPEILTMFLDAGVSPTSVPYDGNQPLMEAADHGSEELVRILVEAGADVSFIGDYGYTALIEAAAVSAEVTEILLDAGADVGVETHSGRTALLEAISKSNINTTRLLLNAGADPNRQTVPSSTPLGEAAFHTSMPAVQALLDAGADPNQPFRDNRRHERADSGYPLTVTPLIVASGQGSEDIVERLLASGARVDLRASDGRTALHGAVALPQTTISRLLLDAGASPSIADDSGETPLFHAACSDRFEMVPLLLSDGATVSHQDERNRTALFRAVQCNSPTTLRDLLDAGADPTVTNRFGTPAIEVALEERHYKVRSLLSEYGAEAPDGSTHWWDIFSAGGTRPAGSVTAAERQAFIEKARDGKIDAMQAELDEGMHPDMRAGSSWTGALHVAAADNNPGLARLLLDAGANPDLRNRWHDTPLVIALTSESMDVVDVLLEAGASLDAKDEDGDTALMHLVYEGAPDLLSVLLDEGADVHRANDDGKTALHVAAGHGCGPCVSTLLNAGARIDARDDFGQTPLLDVAINDESQSMEEMWDMTARLLRAGADLNAYSETGRTVLAEIAQRTQSDALVDTLLRAGADPNGQDALGWKRRYPMRTALTEAIRESNYAVVRRLLDAGANPNARIEDGDTPLICAVRQEDVRLVEALLDAGSTVGAQNHDNATALIVAAAESNLDAVERLLSAGARSDTRNTNGETALDYALDSDPEIASALRASGADLPDQ